MIDWLALALLLALALFSSAAMAQTPLCVLPEEPRVPDSEADLRAYADLVAADIEQYFPAQGHLATANSFPIIQNSCATVLYR